MSDTQIKGVNRTDNKNYEIYCDCCSDTMIGLIPCDVDKCLFCLVCLENNICYNMCERCEKKCKAEARCNRGHPMLHSYESAHFPVLWARFRNACDAEIEECVEYGEIVSISDEQINQTNIIRVGSDIDLADQAFC
jgi:hypothetical protein